MELADRERRSIVVVAAGRRNASKGQTAAVADSDSLAVKRNVAGYFGVGTGTQRERSLRALQRIERCTRFVERNRPVLERNIASEDFDGIRRQNQITAGSSSVGAIKVKRAGAANLAVPIPVTG